VGSRWELVRRKPDKEELTQQPPREKRMEADDKNVAAERWEKVNGRWQLRRQMSSGHGAATNASADPIVEIIPVGWLSAKQIVDNVATNVTAVINGKLNLDIDSGWQPVDDDDSGWQQHPFETEGGWQQHPFETEGGWQLPDRGAAGGWQQVGSTGLWDVQRRDTRAVRPWAAAEDEIDGGGAVVWEPSRQPDEGAPPLSPRSGRLLADNKESDSGSSSESLEDNSIEDRRLLANKKENKKEEEEEEEVEEKKPPKLNVSDKDSPYALLDKYFPERESYFYQNRHSFKNLYGEGGGGGRRQEIGNLQPKEVSFRGYSVDLIYKSTEFHVFSEFLQVIFLSHTSFITDLVFSYSKVFFLMYCTRLYLLKQVSVQYIH
jgi:hypothetical protein